MGRLEFLWTEVEKSHLILKYIQRLQFSSVAQSCLTLWPKWTAAHQASLSITSSWNLLKRMSIESVMPSNHFILYCPLLLLPSIFPSIRVFSNEYVLGSSASTEVLPMNIQDWFSLMTDWFDLLAVRLRPDQIFDQIFKDLGLIKYL